MTSKDPREWTADEVKVFADGAEPDELETVLRHLLADPDEQAVSVISEFLGANHGNVWLKPAASQMATRALLSLGPRGVDALHARLLDPDARVRYGSSVLAAIWEVGRGHGLVEVMSRDLGKLFELELPDDTQEAADRMVRDIVADALVNEDALFLVSQFFSQRTTKAFALNDALATGRDLLCLIGEASIKLSRSVLNEFEALISREDREEEAQVFLAAHPVLLEPLAAEVIPKQRLGLEHATDYAVRSHDGRWLLVEIERPHDEIFTLGNDFRERFTHAFGQALDFQHWVDNNVAYAQRHMPGITAPRGLVVIGRRNGLDNTQQAKLRQFVENSRRIDVVTFDDLLARSRSLYENLWHARD